MGVLGWLFDLLRWFDDWPLFWISLLELVS